MKILHISTYQKGGASIAAIRVHQALLKYGYDSKFLFLECKESNTIFKLKKKNFVVDFLMKVVKKFDIPLSREEYRIRKFKRQFENFSFATTPYTRLHEHPLIQEADIVNLHWIANLVDYRTFFKNINKPIVWTLHDMLPILGAFHYKADEVRNKKMLGELDEAQYTIKQRALKQFSPDMLTVVTPSVWLLNLSKRSEIFKRFAHTHIPYSVNQTIFKLLDKQDCKDRIGLSNEKTNVLFVAENLNNYRKGFDMILELISDEQINSRFNFVAVGKVARNHQIPTIKYLGSISDERDMSLIYNAVDLFIIPSREDNLPNTMIESLCCGTPVVGFNIGGLKESITNRKNGMLATNISVSELKDALLACIGIDDQFDRAKISSDAHFVYSPESQFQAYLKIYEKHLHVNEL